MRLYTQMRSWDLEPLTADMRAAGLDFKLEVRPGVTHVSFWGFAEPLPKLVKLVLGELNKELNTSSPEDETRFKQVKAMEKRSLFGHSKTPVPYALQDRDTMVLKGRYSKGELYEQIDQIKFEDVAGALKRLTLSKPLQFTSLVMGNLARSDAEVLHTSLTEHLQANVSLALDSINLVERVVRPRRPVEVRKMNPKRGDPNQVIVVALLQDIPTIKDRVFFGILSKLFKHTAFSELRTEKQLGYEVKAVTHMMSNVFALTCVVQGKVSPDEVEPIIEWLYSVRMPAVIANMTEDIVRTYTESFVAALKKPPKGFMTEKHHYLKQVARGGKRFGLRSQMIDFALNQTDGVSKKSLVEAWRKAVSSASPEGSRAKVTIKYFSGDAVPSRPESSAAAAELAKAGVNGSTAELYLREHKATMVFNDSSSAYREQVVADAIADSKAKDTSDAPPSVNASDGYFPAVYGFDDDDDDDYDSKEGDSLEHASADGLSGSGILQTADESTLKQPEESIKSANAPENEDKQKPSATGARLVAQDLFDAADEDAEDW
jgi:secreted Zn-dependent insulinase-like peptidase